MRLLVLDAYSESGRRSLQAAGGTAAGALYERLLSRLQPEATIEVGRPSEPSFSLPSTGSLADFDGVVWTGSDLTVRDSDDARVGRQVAVARQIARAGLPSFGSCYGIQIAAVAAGGECQANPRGREFGVSRDLSLSEEGRAHPMYTGKPDSFQGFTCHADIVTALPRGASLLSTNSFSPVQGLAVGEPGRDFWAVQYHPEYDLAEVAALSRLRSPELVEQGFFSDDSEAHRYIERVEALHADPSRDDLAQLLGIDAELLDEEARTLEVRNWLDCRVRPRAGVAA